MKDFKQKILLITGVFPPEPVFSASLANDLAIALSEKWTVKVITPRPTRPMGYYFNKNSIKNEKFEQIVLDSFTCPKSKLFGRMRESISFGKHAVNYINKNGKELKCIYVNTWPLFAQYLIIKASMRQSIPLVIHVQDIYPEALFGKLPFFKSIFYKLLLPIDKYSLNNSTKIVTISANMKKHLIQTRDLDERKVDIVYNWPNDEEFLNYKNSIEKKQKNTKFTFMFLGSLSPSAAINIIINAFKISNIKESRLVIAGDGSEKDSLISLAESNQVENIEFWDAPVAQVPSIQDEADVLLLNLRKSAANFALPSKLPAYMFSEKPIISCVDEESDTANAIKQANCGWIVPPEDVNALATTMRTVSSIPEKELKDYGQNGFYYALKYFSKKNNLQKLVTIINETIES